MLLFLFSDAASKQSTVRFAEDVIGDKVNSKDVGLAENDMDDTSDSDSGSDSDFDDRSISQGAPASDNTRSKVKGNEFEIVPQSQGNFFFSKSS